MKNIYKLLILLSFLFICDNTYAQYPFYGFELSNYEVGDTLEYEFTSQSTFQGYSFVMCNGGNLYVIVKKNTLMGGDSIRYTFRSIGYDYCQNYSLPYYHRNSYWADTASTIINNDSIYNNDNNFFHSVLEAFDSTNIGQALDSSYITFDTTGNLKRLRVQSLNGLGSGNTYEVVQNIGIISVWQGSEYDNSYSSINLIYAHLAHYGIYGTYQKISDGVVNTISPQTNISIRYDNSGNTLLFYSSNENVKPPTLVVYDILGREVETQEVSIGSNLINTNNLSAGIYLYKVINGKEIIGQGKFINARP